MKIEDLNKTQIVLLTLLISFVTSIATGIVTVTLMDQAPPGITQTINRVIERTIETVTPGENRVTTVIKEVVIKEEDLIANAIEKSSKSLVQIKAVDEDGTEVFLSLGVIISGDGYVVTDKDRIAGNRNNLIVKYGVESFTANIVSGEDGEVSILKMIIPEDVSAGETDNKIVLTPASLADSESIKLGQSIVSYGGEGGDIVLTGIVSQLKKIVISSDTANEETEEVEKLSYIVTNIKIGGKSAGGPTLDINGNVLGINVVMSQDATVATIPINDVKDLLFDIINKVEEVEGEGDLTKTQ